MNKFLGIAFVVVVGLFIFQQKNPAKFRQMVVQPITDLKIKLANFSYSQKEKQFLTEKERIEDRYLTFKKEYQEPLEKLISEREEIQTIANPDLSIKEKLAKINQQITSKKSEFLVKKTEIEQQINSLEKRYNDLKLSIQKFQESIQKIREGIQQGQESINNFSQALDFQK